MEFELSKPLQVMNKDAGAYEDHDLIVVTYKGRAGLKAIKHLQDVIFKTFQSTAKNRVSEEKEQQEVDKEDVTVDKVLDMLEMTGSSELVFDEVMGSLKKFATIGTQNLNDALQNEMEMDDLDGLYKKVLRTFLLPKLTQMMNSMSK